MTKGVFSEFEVEEQHIKFAGEDTYSDMNCVGSSEEELEVKSISKKCRGVVVKERTKGTGYGTLTESLHVPYDIYNKMYDMNQDNLKKGVKAYGQECSHPEFSLTQKVVDEDDEVMYKAYPRCVLKSGPKNPIENGQEEVPELELTIALMPDEYGKCQYKALESELDEDLKSQWLNNFTPELVHIDEV